MLSKTWCLLFVGILASICAAGPAYAGHVGTWDSTIYNLMEHPRTVALRIEVVDSETHLPISNACVSLKGTYTTEARTSRHPEGERPSQKKEYELEVRTGKKGVAIVTLGWQKEYPWSGGPADDIEKAQRIDVRHREYRFATVASPFGRFLRVGQRRSSCSQEPSVFKRFEARWHEEGSRDDVRYCTLDLGKAFRDFGNKRSASPEFFEKIRDKEWGTLHTAPRNWFSKGTHPQSLCGPYFVYLIQIEMQRLKNSCAPAPNHPWSAMAATPHALAGILFTALEEDYGIPPRDVEWSVNFLEGLKWSMSGSEVEKVLADKEYRLKVVGSFTVPETGAVTHRAKVPGQFIYGQIRVGEVQMGFAHKKLISISFTAINESDADAFYLQSREMFGRGLEKAWVDNEVRQDLGRAESSRICNRFYEPTAVESRISYSWDNQKKRHVRYSHLRLSDWRRGDKAYGRDHSSEAMRFGRLIKNAEAGQSTTCNDCNGSGKCLHCKGEGYTYVKETMRCNYPACRGRGRYKVFGGGIRICSRCQGTGRLKSGKQVKKRCGKCGGTGKCRTCKGAGSIRSRN